MVPKLKASKESLKARLERAKLKGKPKGLTSGKAADGYGRSGYFDDTLNDMLEVIELKRALEKTEDLLSDVEAALNVLDKRHKKILELWYFRKASKERIAEDLGYSEASMRTIYSLHNRALFEFSVIYFGADAI